MKPACEQAIEEIYLYIDHELTWWRRRRIRRHLANCRPCLEGYTFEQRLRVIVKECLSEEVPPEFLNRLQQAIQRERGTVLE
ncbi:MAG TPA: mycothiol system anti-sigma-R factor [Acidimicrobiia bacterium]|jgi:mycothiol system anti-sigma-R factor